MRPRLNVNTGYGQFRWVVLLLIVAVILPTVCLLWFMNEAIENERLVIRQKLVTFYKNQLNEAMRSIDDDWAARCARFGQAESTHPYQEFVAAAGQDGCDALLIYDDAGQRLYPVLSTDSGAPVETAELFDDAWQLEFVERDYAQAAQLYENHARSALTDPRRFANLIREGLSLPKTGRADDAVYDRQYLAALIGQSRSLGKLDRIAEAVTVCRQAAFSPLAETEDTALLSLAANARLLLLSWVRDRGQYTNLLEETFARLTGMLFQPNQAGASLTADQNLFVAQKALEIAQDNPSLQTYVERIHKTTLATLIAAEQRSIDLAERFPTTAALEAWQPGKLRPLTSDEEGPYGLAHQTDQRTYFAVLSDDTIRSRLASLAATFRNDYIDCRILDEASRPLAGSPEPLTEPFAAGTVGTYFPDWQIELFFKQGDVLDRAAGDQIAVYTWTGTLVILLILIFGAVAANSIGRQVRLNRLKNDFIATVTHELKTPLASTRLLVDTLLEGNYRDQQQVTDYLQLISNENGRLSRLIDNFLTFSRMERNKQAFQMRPTRPEAIARAAADAVATKFGTASCQFDVDIPADLPDVMADPDAMVTVLVNLLDNAYKYSHDDKHIALRLSLLDDHIAFTVSDNGLGIPRRVQKRIFKRFYQVDRRLARRAEGCGLGLSIAKFIVDAHAGSISIESRPNQGSTFTVKLPARAERQ